MGIPQRHSSLGSCSSFLTPPPKKRKKKEKNIFISTIKQFFLHANPSKQSEANLLGWASSIFSGVPDSLADICPTVCGTQSSCPVSTDWSEAVCRGGTRHTAINDALHLWLKRIFISFNNTFNSLEIMSAVLLTAPAVLFFCHVYIGKVLTF